MGQKYFVDTLVYRDYYENRSDNFRPLGEWALEFFRKAAGEGGIILYCDMVLAELEKDYKPENVILIFKILNGMDVILMHVEPSNVQAREAKSVAKNKNVSFADALYAILARDNNAIIVTRDAHFLLLTDIAESRKPEELI
ncbi:MAG: PIN domain-containing protein [Candidatus Nanoarchaeia archaeon]|nr:PIN domain-containing protein [Candidatus Nanoarchaeia archaeon]